MPDWVANGTPHATTLTNVSVARALVADVLRDAFLSHQRHSVAFQKVDEGGWNLQPAAGGASTDISPRYTFEGYIDVHYDIALKRHVMLMSNDTEFADAESVDALSWTRPMSIGRLGPIAAYPTAVGFGADPEILGASGPGPLPFGARQGLLF